MNGVGGFTEPQLAVLAEKIRSMYIAKRRSYIRHTTQKDSSYSPGAQWDGGYSQQQRRHVVPVWPRIAAFVAENGLNAENLVNWVFTHYMASLQSYPYPTHLCGSGALDIYRDAQDKDADEVVRSLKLQQQSLANAVGGLQVLDDELSEREALAETLFAREHQLSALFRYCVAFDSQLVAVCAAFEAAAAVQYMSNSAEYDRHWGGFIPVTFKQRAPGLYRRSWV